MASDRRRQALRKSLRPLRRAFVAGLMIGLFLCMAQSAVNAQGRQCPGGQMFCFGKCVDTSSDQANCGGCRIPCRTGEVCTRTGGEGEEVMHMPSVLRH